MTDVHTNNIQSLSKVAETAQSGYAPKGLPARELGNNHPQSLTLTVLSAQNNHVVLQEQTSAKRFNLPAQSFGELTSSALAKGDKLVLVSSNDKQAIFKLEQANVSNKHANLKPFTQTLSAQWPDIHPSIIKQTHSVVLNQIQLSGNSIQAKQLAAAVLEIANKTGQPILSIKVDANVTFVGKAKALSVEAANAINVRFNVSIGTNKTIVLDIPLQPELISKLNNGSNVKLTLNADNPNALIANIDILKNGKSVDNISASALRNINKGLVTNASSLTQSLNTLLALPQSAPLKNGIAIAPTPQNLVILGNGISQPLLKSSAAIATVTLQDARILVAQTLNNSQQIQVSLVAKPIVLALDKSALAALDPKLFQGEFSKANSSVANLASVSKSELTGSVPTSVLKSVTGAEQVSSSLIKDKLISMLLAQGNDAQQVQKTIAQLQSTISHELNQILPRSESAQASLPSLLTHLRSMQQEATGDTKVWLTKAIEAIEKLVAKPAPLANQNTSINSATKSVAAQDKLAAMSQILSNESGISTNITIIDEISVADIDDLKRDFTASYLPNITAISKGPFSASGQSSSLVNGLVSMLQASLQAKLLAQQPSLLNNLLNSSAAQMAALASINSARSPAASNNSKASQVKLLQDLQKLDPKGNLIAELNKALSQHSLHKLAAAESSLQGQDSFYYTLPNLFSPQHQDIELVIRREQQQSQNQQDANAQQAWQLNMKLDIGDSGDVLAKVKLFNNNVELNLYASNQLLKERILDYMPYLKRRLIALGMEVKQQCYLGKIPSTLHKTDFQVVQAYV